MYHRSFLYELLCALLLLTHYIKVPRLEAENFSTLIPLPPVHTTIQANIQCPSSATHVQNVNIFGFFNNLSFTTHFIFVILWAAYSNIFISKCFCRKLTAEMICTSPSKSPHPTTFFTRCFGTDVTAATHPFGQLARSAFR